MNQIKVHYIIKKPTHEKLIDLINKEGINNIPLFVYTIQPDQSQLTSELTEFTLQGNSYYFFSSNIKKTLIYNTDMISTISMDNVHSLFISNMIAM